MSASSKKKTGSSKEGKGSKKGLKTAPTYRIAPDSPWAGAWKIAGVLGGLGLGLSLFGWSLDAHRFAFAWLFAFMTFLALGLGSLFFVIALHLTGAAWGVTIRRTAEFLAVGLPAFAVLFIPLALNLEEVYPWMTHGAEDAAHEESGHGDAEHGDAAHEEHGDAAHEEHGSILPGLFDDGVARAQDLHPEDWRPSDTRPEAPRNRAGAEHSEAGEGEAHGAHHDPEHAIHSEVISAKHGYLNQGFFFIRAGVYFALWMLLSIGFFIFSTRQDKEKGLAITKRLQSVAPISTFIFGLSLTFAAFDWMMSLEPAWYSTMFGVQYFAVSAVVAHAVIILLALALRNAGHLGDAVNVEHFHDVGKLLFGFNVFWAYISFSQFMLIWYAGIPEEATYYHLRWWGGGSWLTVSVVLIFAHFVIPFFVLMSRNAKRRLPILAFGAAWLVVAHILEVYWLVMPYAEQTGLVATSLRVQWIDFAAFFAVGGTYLGVVLWMMTRYPLIPVGDPRLARALHFENA